MGWLWMIHFQHLSTIDSMGNHRSAPFLSLPKRKWSAPAWAKRWELGGLKKSSQHVQWLILGNLYPIHSYVFYDILHIFAHILWKYIPIYVQCYNMVLELYWVTEAHTYWGCNGDMHCTHEYGLKPMGPIFWLGGRKSITTCTSYFGLDTQCSRVLTHTAGILVTSTTNEWPWKSCDQQNCLDFFVGNRRCSGWSHLFLPDPPKNSATKKCPKWWAKWIFLRVGGPSSHIDTKLPAISWAK